jgi:hypothetical protein
MHAAAAIAAVVGVGLALFAFYALRGQAEMPAAAEESAAEEPLKPRRRVPAPTPARECF